MKRLISIFFAAILLSSAAPVGAEEDATIDVSKTVAPFVRLECELPELWGDRTILSTARVKETGKILPLSFTYDDAVYVQTNLPVESLEAFVAEKPKNYSDLDEGYIFSVNFWTVRGVFQGDGDGNFRGKDSISRAEAAAVIARFMGIEPTEDTDSGFSDVAPDSWYAPIVTAAKEAGIVSSDELFRPDSKVLRQEFFAMACRAFDALGWLHQGCGEDRVFADFDKADAYAQEIYKRLEDSGMRFEPFIRREEIGQSEDGTWIYGEYLDPKNEMMRRDAAELLYWGISDLPVVPSKTAMMLGLDQEMPRIDGSTSSYPITESAYWKLFSNARFHEARPAVHSKTIQSYKKLIAGEADVILVPDPNEEVQQLAKDSGVELLYIPIADEALVFFTSAQNPTEGLSSQQIKDIYVNNRYDNWSQVGGADKKLIPFCRNNDSGSHAQMEMFFLDGKEINEEIRRENTSVMMASILTDVVKSDAENSDSFAMGYSMFYYFKNAGMVLGLTDPYGNNALKLLAVDGVLPTEESIADRSYPLSTHYYAVLRADEPEDSAARKFAGLLSSEAGAQIILNAGFSA